MPPLVITVESPVFERTKHRRGFVAVGAAGIGVATVLAAAGAWAPMQAAAQESERAGISPPGSAPQKQIPTTAIGAPARRIPGQMQAPGQAQVPAAQAAVRSRGLPQQQLPAAMRPAQRLPAAQMPQMQAPVGVAAQQQAPARPPQKQGPVGGTPQYQAPAAQAPSAQAPAAQAPQR